MVEKVSADAMRPAELAEEQTLVPLHFQRRDDDILLFHGEFDGKYLFFHGVDRHGQKDFGFPL